MLRELIQHLLHVQPASWAQGGQWRLELLAWPGHDVSLALGAVVLAAGWGLVWLYRREGRNVGALMLGCLVCLRLIVLLGVLAMLLEPLLVFSKTEMVPSTLVVLQDASDSMGFRDAFVDAGRARRVADALKLRGPAE